MGERVRQNAGYTTLKGRIYFCPPVLSEIPPKDDDKTLELQFGIKIIIQYKRRFNFNSSGVITYLSLVKETAPVCMRNGKNLPHNVVCYSVY